MPLQFLVPAFLAGLAALAIPIFVHLTRKERTKVVPFPSLMFLRRVPFRDDSKRRIHHWMLLALRALAVMLIVAAFARPFLDRSSLLASAGAGPREVVVLVDRSYSMAVGDQWQRAQAAARDALQGLGPLDRASLVFFDHGAQAPVRSTSDVSRLFAALDSASVGWGSTRYGPGLRLAQTILEESELPQRELVLVGDFQRGDWTGDEGVQLPAGTKLVPVLVRAEPSPNVAVAGVELARDRFSGQERVRATARLIRTGGDGTIPVRVALDVDGRELESKTVQLPPNGAATAAFNAFTLVDLHTRGTIRVDPDALVQDDAYHFVLSPGRSTPVVVLQPPSAAPEVSLYLARALEISTGAGFNVDVRSVTTASPQVIADAAVVVLNDVPYPSGAIAKALLDRVTEGGGVVVLLGERSQGGAGDTELLPGRVGTIRDRERAARLGFINYDHEVFSVFRGPRSGDFTGARFFRTRDVTPAEGTEVLARFDDGTPALLERRVGEGRVLVWTSSMDALWNDLSLQPVFLPFVHQLFRHAAGRGEVLPSFPVGSVIDVTDARAMAAAGLVEDGQGVPFGGEERVVLSPAGGALRLMADGARNFLDLKERGFYLLRPPGQEGVRPLAVAVNVDLAESDRTQLDPQEWAASLTPTAAPTGRGGGAGRAVELQREDQEQRQSLWRWLLAGAFVLLVLETVIANRISRRTQGPGMEWAADGAGAG